MNLNEITNETIFSIDWAASDRQNFLQSIPKSKKQKDKKIAPGITARCVWNQDVSGMDRRSSKFMQNGKFYGRATWWNAFDTAMAFLKPSSALEQRMYVFHKMHHSITFFYLELIQDYNNKKKEIERTLVDMKV